MARITTTEYSRLRKAAEQRTKRLEAHGFSGYHAPKVREISGEDLAREYRKIEKWMAKESSTVPGARAVEERRAAEEEARRERKREANRRYRERKRQEQGRAQKTRPPKQSEEERRRRHAESQRRYQQKKNVLKNIDRYNRDDKKAAQALKNLYSGLKKWNIDVKSYEELKAWGDYIAERSVDSDKDFYTFDKWVSSLVDKTGNTPEQVDARAHLKAEDIYNVINDFNQWRDQKAELEAQFTAERRADEYAGDKFGDLWDMYMNRQ